MSELVTQGPLDLAGKQIAVMAKVTLQSVAIDDDSILVAFARDTISEVLAICMCLGPEIGDHDRDFRQYLLEFAGQPIDRIDNHRFELIESGVGHTSNTRAAIEREGLEPATTDYESRRNVSMEPNLGSIERATSKEFRELGGVGDQFRDHAFSGSSR
jgi:hypothetical protein